MLKILQKKNFSKFGQNQLNKISLFTNSQKKLYNLRKKLFFIKFLALRFFKKLAKNKILFEMPKNKFIN